MRFIYNICFIQLPGKKKRQKKEERTGKKKYLAGLPCPVMCAANALPALHRTASLLQSSLNQAFFLPHPGHLFKEKCA